MNAELVLFAINAGIKLGRKVHQVLIDETHERPMVLPLGDLFGSISNAEALEFFACPENHHLTGDGGPYHGLPDSELIKAYKTIEGIRGDLGSTASRDDAIEIVTNLHRYEQYREGFGAQPPVKRLLGTAVEIGVDYFIANPQAIGGDSRSRQLIKAFIMNLDEVDFAENDYADIAGQVLRAGLQVLGDNVELITDDERVGAIVSGVAGAFIEDYDKLIQAGVPLGEQLARKDFLKRIGTSIVRGSAAAAAENPAVFIDGNKPAKQVAHKTVVQLLEGIKGKEDLFTADTLELLARSALGAIAEHPELVTDHEVVKQFIARSLTALTQTDGPEPLFSKASVALVLKTGLDLLGENAAVLINPASPEEQLLADALAAIAAGLSSTVGNGSFRKLFSAAQLVELAQIVLQQVAANPEALVSGDDPRRTALAQIIGSVAKALSDSPHQILTAAGAIELLRTAAVVAVNNADKLLDLETDDPTTNILYRVLSEYVTAVLSADDPRKLLNREAVLKTAQKILNAASANLDRILHDDDELVKLAVERALGLANDALQNRTNGQNMPQVIETLFIGILRETIDMADDNAVRAAIVAELDAD
jgi:hypothetical protein